MNNGSRCFACGQRGRLKHQGAVHSGALHQSGCRDKVNAVGGEGGEACSVSVGVEGALRCFDIEESSGFGDDDGQALDG